MPYSSWQDPVIGATAIAFVGLLLMLIVVWWM